jgi:hypothetical protein
MIEKKITYKTLMKKINDGKMEVSAWSLDMRSAIIATYRKNGSVQRHVYHIKNAPCYQI